MTRHCHNSITYTQLPTWTNKSKARYGKNKTNNKNRFMEPMLIWPNTTSFKPYTSGDTGNVKRKAYTVSSKRVIVLTKM